MGALYVTWRRRSRWFALFCFIAPGHVPASAQVNSNASAALSHPAGVAVDPRTGLIYFAERDGHRIWRLSASGAMEVVAGTGVQGFAGDGGPATAALLNSPAAVAIAPSGDLYITDTGNNRVRAVSALSGTIRTLAGSATQGYGGDGGPAVNAALSHPTGLAVDGAGNVVIADTGNSRIRSVSGTTGTITTLAGDGSQGFSGDGGPALAARLNGPASLAYSSGSDLFIADTGNARVRVLDHGTGQIRSLPAALLRRPAGIAFDSAQNLLVTDSSGNQLLRIDPQTGATESLSGTGPQAFSGDGGDARSALLNGPDGVAALADGSVLLADSGNNRLRLLTPAQQPATLITTIAGSGAVVPSGVLLTGSSAAVYGSVRLRASLASTVATGAVTLRDLAHPSLALASGNLQGGVADLLLPSLPAGTHQLVADFGGDATHPASRSAPLALTVAPLTIAATPSAVVMLYGQTPPQLSGTISGVLAQDSGAVGAVFQAAASSFSAPGAYPIAAALTGPAAANYTVQTNAAALVVSKAPSAAALVASGAASGNITVYVSSTTTGTPTGTVALSDQSGPLASGSLANGSWSVATTQLPSGTHHLQAIYGGDGDFLGSASTVQALTTAGGTAVPVDTADFSLSVAATSLSISVTAGNTADVPMTVTPLRGELAGPVLLSASGLPAFASASFDPELVPPGQGPQTITLHIRTSPSARATDRGRNFTALAALLPMLLLATKRGRRSLTAFALTIPLIAVSVGCGDRVASTLGSGGPSPAQTYAVLVTATTTGADGKLLQHTATVQMQVMR